MSFLQIRKKPNSAAKNEDPKVLPLEANLLGLTNEASEKIIKLLKEKAFDEGFLRVGLKGGGCSGLTIFYELSERAKDHDLIFANDGARICIDPKSLKILGGATLHARENLGGTEFVLLNNPAAKQCSCGQSFSL